MASATIKLFLLHGDPQRFRTAEISNWSGKAPAAPRAEFDYLLGREELGSSGVYILTGMDPNDGHAMAYIGEAGVLRDRLKDHRKLEFWVRSICSLSKDENLTKSHIKYLEGKLISLANEVKRYRLTNGQSSGAKLPGSDREDMEVFLEKISQLLPVLGTDLITPAAQTKPNEKRVRYSCRIKNLKFTCGRTLNGFVVHKGSEAVLNCRPSAQKQAPYVIKPREQLISDGSLKQRGLNCFFTQDCKFSNPSTAAGVVLGGTAAGPVAWKTDGGLTLKEIEEKGLG